MRVAVVTPYFREELDVLRNCHESVRRQTAACMHFMVADGFPRNEIGSWEVEHIVLARAHGDVGNTPRAIGGISAMNQGFDAIAFLDADNWYDARHIEEMIKLHERTGAAVCSATRMIHAQDGTALFVDCEEGDGTRHVDTSCYFLTARAFSLLPLWAMMPKELGPVGDHILWRTICALGLSRAHCPKPTVAFRTQYEIHYRRAGRTPPPGFKSAQTTNDAFKWWASLPPDVKADWERRMNLRK